MQEACECIHALEPYLRIEMQKNREETTIKDTNNLTWFKTKNYENLWLSKHVITQTKQENQKETELKLRKEKKRLELNTLKKTLFKLDFDRSPQSIYSQPNTKVINNLKTRRSRLENASIKKIDLKMFCEKLSLWFTISSKS